MRMIEREVQILRQVNHPHLIHLLEVIETSKNSSGGPGVRETMAEGGVGGGDIDAHSTDCKYKSPFFVGVFFFCNAVL